VTRCPACSTPFKVVKDQLKLGHGWVRCGRCGHAFHAASHFVTLPGTASPAAATVAAAQPTAAPPTASSLADDSASTAVRAAAADDGDAFERTVSLTREELAQAAAQALRTAIAHREPPATSTPVADVEAPAPAAASAGATAPGPAADGGAAHDAVPPSVPILESVESSFMPSTSAGFTSSELREAGETLIRFPATAVHVATDVGAETALPSEAHPSFTADEPGFVQAAERAARWQRTPVRIALALLLVAGLAAAALQAAYQFRAEAVAWRPEVKPLLQTVCHALGCAVEPLHRIGDVSIESHALAKTDSGYELSVLLRNRAPLANGYPHIELTLTDLTDMPVARRVVSPAEYLRAGDAADAGLMAHGEYKAVVRLVPQGLAINGYRLLVFYP
jgi:predicted Zn finger-like uncharacterized protein